MGVINIFLSEVLD